MIDIVKNKWRAYILLHEVTFDMEDKAVETGSVIYYDITHRADIFSHKDGSSTLVFSDEHFYNVKESAKDIIDAASKLIQEEIDEQAKATEERTLKAVKNYESMMKKGKK